MKYILTVFILISLILPANACLIEYRVVTFIPKDGRYVQKVSEDFAFNLSNPFDFTITDVSLTYRGLNVRYPKLLSGEVKNERFELKPEKLNVSLMYKVEGDSKGFKVEFVFRNYYNHPLNVRIVFPKPRWFKGCVNCSVEGGKVVFNRSVSKECTFTLFGSGGGKLKIGDGRLSFFAVEKANLSFSAELPFSITKYKKDKWYALCTVKNDKPVEFNVKVYGYVNESEPIHDFNNSKLVFFREISLKPNESFKFEMNSTAKSPAFFVKVEPTAKTTCKVWIYPATKIGKHYVQYGILRGFSFTIKPVIVTPPVVGGGGGGTILTHKKEVSQTKPTVKPSKPISPPPTEVLPRKPSNVPLIYPVVRSNVIASLNIGGVTINQIRADKPTIATTMMIALTPLWLVLPLSMVRTRFVFDSADFTLEEATYFTRVLVPRGVEIGRILPGDVVFEEPNFELARYIHEVYDIPLNSAKAIALALEHSCPVYLSDLKAWVVALKLGYEAYLRR